MTAAIGIGHNGGPPLTLPRRPRLWVPKFEPWRLLRPLRMDQWFPGQRLQFEEDFGPNVAALGGPVGGGEYEFNLTAGTDGDWVGYDTGAISGTFGSIDVQPVPGHTLLAFLNEGADIAAVLSGDATALMDGRHVWVDGIDYGPGDTGTQWDDLGGSTIFQAQDSELTLEDGNNYFVEFKPLDRGFISLVTGGSSANSTSQTLSGVDFGPGGFVVVGGYFATSSSGGSFTISSATIGGQTAVIHAQDQVGGANVGRAFLMSAENVPSGTGDVALTLDVPKAGSAWGVGSYYARGLVSTTRRDLLDIGGGTNTGGIDVPYNGFLVSVFASSGTPAFSAGVTQDDTVDLGGIAGNIDVVVGHASALQEQVNRTVTITGGSGTQSALFAVSWG